MRRGAYSVPLAMWVPLRGPVFDSQPHAIQDLHSSSPASRHGRGTAMVSVGVAASVWLGAGRVGATSSIARAPGSMAMPCRRILYSWYT